MSVKRLILLGLLTLLVRATGGTGQMMQHFFHNTEENRHN
jgi:hypothetical protein